jgi:D-alanyl-lipoteichoic acid acyltransferase DltB (MBOAT superfamily)
MIFNSVTYIVFLIAAVCLYRLLPRRLRLWMVFLSSCAFYAFWRIEYLPLVLVSAVTDYAASLRIAASPSKRIRSVWLGVSLFINLGLLFYFKYTFFFADNLCFAMRLVGADCQPPVFNIILPLGISFYTFQTISYTVDVYRGFIKPEKDFVLYASYVMFFPQLVAGPILRAGEIIWQLSERAPFSLLDISLGLRRILYGLFLKVVIADNIAPAVNSGFALSINAVSAWDVWTLAFLFGFQIYFDFSAYSHIAVGSARLMGIRLMENFNFPYMACSPKDFWLRWHISLSSWIRDYLYLPLCGIGVEDRSTGGLGKAVDAVRGKAKRIGALFATWMLMGLWHGANWTFVLWGLWHACFICLYRLTEPIRSRLPVPVRLYGGWATTAASAMLAWIFFRSEGTMKALGMYGRLLTPSAYLWRGMKEKTYLLAALLLVLTTFAYVATRHIIPSLRNYRAAWCVVETTAFTAVFLLVIIFLRPISQFIYFQF